MRSPRLLLLAAVACTLWGARSVRADPPSSRQKVALRAGEAVEFSAAPAGATGTWQWRLDGRPAATARSWTFAPDVDAVGTHRVQVTATSPGGRRVQTWAVRVRPPRPPRIVSEVPSATTIDLPTDGSTDLVLRTGPAAPGDALHVQWTLDGTPAGEGEQLHVTGTRPGTMRARAVVTSGLGVAVAREWRIVVTPPPTVVAAAPAPPSTTTPSAPPVREAAKPTTTLATVARVAPTTTEPARRVPEPAAPSPMVALQSEPPPAMRGVSAPEIRSFLERYAAAWRSRDVEALARIGQVTSERQAAALHNYFDGVQDFDVEVELLDVRTDGDRAIVRFTRRDHFRNPGGQMVSKESPPIEKEVVRTSTGLRFAPPTP